VKIGLEMRFAKKPHEPHLRQQSIVGTANSKEIGFFLEMNFVKGAHELLLLMRILLLLEQCLRKFDGHLMSLFGQHWLLV
jgi:hypothetical protein